MKGTRKVCQLMERSDGDVERCDTCPYIEGLFDSHEEKVSLRNI